jgi:AraC-like DNA-binding protein
MANRPIRVQNLSLRTPSARTPDFVMRHSTPEVSPSFSPSGVRWADASTAIMLRQKRFSPFKLVALLDAAAEVGVDPDPVLAATGLDRAALADPFQLTSAQQFLDAARLAVRAYGQEDLGMRVGQRLHVSSYGMYGYALLCSTTMADAFDTAVRYHQLANGMLDIHWIEEGDTVSWIVPAQHALRLPDIDERLYRFLIDLQFAVHATLIREVMGAWCVPLHATLTSAPPPHAAQLANLIGCPLRFGQPQNRISYPLAWANRAPRLADPITAAQLSVHCARMVEEFQAQAETTRQVFGELTRAPGQFPGLDEIAARLGMNARTLRRRLDAEGASYGALLTSVRHALALDYLCTTDLCVENIALALGFSDAVSFRHAFKRWTGRTPNEVRRDR